MISPCKRLLNNLSNNLVENVDARVEQSFDMQTKTGYVAYLHLLTSRSNSEYIDGEYRIYGNRSARLL